MTKNEDQSDCSSCRDAAPTRLSVTEVRRDRAVGNELEAVMIAINIEPSQSPDNASHTLELHG